MKTRTIFKIEGESIEHNESGHKIKMTFFVAIDNEVVTKREIIFDCFSMNQAQSIRSNLENIATEIYEHILP